MMALRRPSMGSLRLTPQASSTTTHHTKGMHTTVMQHLMRNTGSCAEHTELWCPARYEFRISERAAQFQGWRRPDTGSCCLTSQARPLVPACNNQWHGHEYKHWQPCRLH